MFKPRHRNTFSYSGDNQEASEGQWPENKAWLGPGRLAPSSWTGSLRSEGTVGTTEADQELAGRGLHYSLAPELKSDPVTVLTSARFVFTPV